jgi:hypothetical protein
MQGAEKTLRVGQQTAHPSLTLFAAPHYDRYVSKKFFL